MENPFLVTEIYSTEDLFDYGFGLFLINGVVFRVDELLQIILVKVENNLQVLFNCFVDHFSQGDDVWMLLEVFQGGDLSQCG